ncbi:MAG: peptide-methionine (S)-S-oxide reductase [Candidatus Paceibacteria bacterium]|jgi:peptide-methionine (S)-S-oxide reductase
MNNTAIFGAGCFWGVERSFADLTGVKTTRVGYMGGEVDNPSYDQVCSDNTGHVEVVEIVFNPEEITYKELLGKFWEIHDPTQLNRQGSDVGTQYKSVIFTTSIAQAKEAVESLQSLNNYEKVVTSIESATTFFEAEEYHQKYLDKKNKNTGN